MSKKPVKNEQPQESRNIDSLSLVELKAAAFDLAGQRQLIEVTYANVIKAIEEKTQALVASNDKSISENN